MGGIVKGVLSRIKLTSDSVEVYPEAITKAPPPKPYKTEFNTNTTFVTFSHLMRAMMGPTILAIPAGFKFGGLALAPPGFFLLLMLVSFNMRRLILNAAYLSLREGVNVRTFDQVAYVSFYSCTVATKKYAGAIKATINALFIITYLDACVIFMIFLARNVEAIFIHYFPYTFLEVRYFIFLQVIFLMSMCTLRELKQMSPFSLTAALLLIAALVILIAFFFLAPIGDFRKCQLLGTDRSIMHFICVVLFCLSGVSIALTLKSSMKNPEHFMSFPGIFYISIFSIGVLFTLFGSFGYLKYASETKPSILFNLPTDNNLGISAKLLATISVLLTTPLVFYVAFNVLWSNYLKDQFSPINVLFSEYFIRFCMIVFCFIVAMAYPDLGRMIVLKGALFHSHLEVTIPPILDYVTNYPEYGTGRFHCRLVRTLLIASLGIAFCIGGVIVAILDWSLTV